MISIDDVAIEREQNNLSVLCLDRSSRCFMDAMNQFT